MTSRLQVHLSAKNLKNLGGLLSGVSNPFAVITVRGDSPNNPPHVLGQTDVVFASLNPSWSKSIFLDGYKFGVPYYIEVGVFDFDVSQTGKSARQLAQMDAHSQQAITGDASNRNLLRNGKFPHKIMGTALFEVGEVIGGRGNMRSKSLQTGGAVYVHIERCSAEGEKGRLRFQLRGRKLHNVQSIGKKSSPFFELYRKVERPTGATWMSVYRSNVVKSSLNPTWNQVTLDLEATCNGDLDRAMKVMVWDHRRGGKHKTMGEFETTMRGFLEAKEAGDNFEFSVMKVDKDMGNVLVLFAELFQADAENGSVAVTEADPASALPPPEPEKSPKQAKPEFVDYLSGGCQISLAVAIDFTASNGDPRQEGTPHYFHPPESKEWNDYEKAIFAVGSILAKYDSDQKFPVWGFGAKYNNIVRHCFQCGSEVEVEGVQGIMDAYRGVFRTPLTMSYPTKFTEVIQTAASYARHEQEVSQEENKLSYTILLILTAGNIENVKETKQQLIEASSDPLSVVIVGIGEADFKGMAFLDEHDAAVEEGRDITKFVRFNDYKSFNALTEAVLDEIPDQLVDFFFERGLLPGQVEGLDQNDVEVQDADDDDRTFTFLG
ncbi:Copine-6 [Seminavis robusta]|uniref:Copine-6 n=1 Tax=Seminavis robusta TaxID=568900 RepID=A0A9N8EWC0_9STRA|nr:Copine-6 [Seminavis robusta]|eukprot:Sro1892_g303840.1 Copine-6 (605) ;mRNA; r:6637-8901